MSARWTPARVAALRAFARTGTARVSNETNDVTVHWRTGEWLRESGLAAYCDGWGWELLELTPAGVQALADLGPPHEQLAFDPADEPC